MAWLVVASGCELMLGEIPADALVSDSGVSPLFPTNLDEDASVASDASTWTPPEPATDNDAQQPPAMSPEGEDEPDAAEEPSENCEQPTSWYADEDGDGFGSGPASARCENPGEGWAPKSGDCADHDARVFPGQRSFFGHPFVRLDGHRSFDYDCSGGEEGDPSQDLDPQCSTTPGPQCAASGYLKTNRNANGANPYCGSVAFESCKASLAVVLCKASTATVSTPYGCR